MSLNRLGDRQYLDKDVRGAMRHYKEALRIRQESCQGAEPMSAEAELGVVTSLLKVADAEQVGGQSWRCMCYILSWETLCITPAVHAVARLCTKCVSTAVHAAYIPATA